MNFIFLCAKKDDFIMVNAKLIAAALTVAVVTSFATTHWELQAVNSSGVATHPDLQTANKVTVQGILLNRSETFLDPAARYNETPFDLGGQWQIFVQGENGDHAGSAVWMGQCYANLPWGVGRYTNQQWQDELYRLNHDPNTGYAFRPGDRIEVTGLLKFYNGKTNINERHATDPAYDVTIRLIKAGLGLPAPEEVTLDQLKDSTDNFIFDPSRLTGPEFYQARLVRLNGVSFVTPSLWAPGAEMTVTDGSRTFPVVLGNGGGFALFGNNLADTFDLVGIMDQENSSTAGYHIWVPDYDGNGLVLQAGLDAGKTLTADTNNDSRVDLFDLAVLAQQWLKTIQGY